MEKVRPNIAIDVLTKNSRLPSSAKIKTECLMTSSAVYQEDIATKIKTTKENIYLQEITK